MYDKPKAIARAKDRENTYIWVWGAESDAPACISRLPPTDKTGCKSLQALLAHLQLDEWEMVLDE